MMRGGAAKQVGEVVCGFGLRLSHGTLLIGGDRRGSVRT